ncbi:MAG TPA: cysteine--tRNA ligase, partial [Ferruginibacter sp.]|nr:cysteine--tRNA ligase [Ferruginibacter sp.]
IHGGGMELQFPHHESEIAQSTICNHTSPVNYWMHNNMITINGRKMGKSYNNVIKLTELFSGDHPLLSQPFHPMTVRFFILQSHYRSTLDFSNDALQASEKAFKRLWESHELLQKISVADQPEAVDIALQEKISGWLNELEAFMDDDFSTPKVLANLFELAPVINSVKGGQIAAGAIAPTIWLRLQAAFKLYLEDIFGLQAMDATNNETLQGVMDLLIDIRRDARSKKDFATSDKIRDALGQLGIQLKDEKDGSVSWGLS